MTYRVTSVSFAFPLTLRTSRRISSTCGAENRKEQANEGNKITEVDAVWQTCIDQWRAGNSGIRASNAAELRRLTSPPVGHITEAHWRRLHGGDAQSSHYHWQRRPARRKRQSHCRNPFRQWRH